MRLGRGLFVEDVGDVASGELRGEVVPLFGSDEAFDFFESVFVDGCERQRADNVCLAIGRVAGKLMVEGIEIAIVAFFHDPFCEPGESPFLVLAVEGVASHSLSGEIELLNDDVVETCVFCHLHAPFAIEDERIHLFLREHGIECPGSSFNLLDIAIELVGQGEGDTVALETLVLHEGIKKIVEKFINFPRRIDFINLLRRILLERIDMSGVDFGDFLDRQFLTTFAAESEDKTAKHEERM